MLAIRMQRTGRKGHAMFRVVVQDSRRTPTSGKIVMLLGSYDPHSKAVVLNKDKASYYLEHGAQPSDRVVKLLVAEGVELPEWVSKPGTDKKRSIRNIEKLRRNRPAEPAEEKPADTADAAEEKPAEVEPTEANAEESTESKTESADDTEKLVDEPSAEAPAEAEKSDEAA